MKKNLLKGLALVAMLFGAMTISAKQYCHEELTNGDNKIYLTAQKLSDGNYQIKVEADVEMNGLGGSFCNVNGVGGYQLNAEGHFVLSADKKTITMDIASNADPNLYTPLYVLMPGEVAYTWPTDVEWGLCEGGTVEPTPVVAEIDTVYMWNGSRGESTATSAEEKGGTASVYLASGTNIVVGTAQKTNWTIKLNKGYKATEQYSVIICLDEAVKKGDKLVLGAFRTTESAAVLAVEFNADSSALNQNNVIEESDLQVITSNVAPTDTIYNIPDGAEGSKFIRLYRKSGSTGIYVSKIMVTREKAAAPVTPELPETAAPVPTWPADQVIALYSDAYTVNPTWGYLEDWGQSTQLEAKAIGEDHYLYYTNFNYLGWACAGAVNALNMEKLHIDVYTATAGKLGIVPIYGGSGLATDDQKRKMVDLQEGWNSFDLDLATDYAGLNLASIYQFKCDNGTIQKFAIDNVYFYRTTPLVDETKPTNLKGSVASTSYFSAVLTVSAEDNMGAVNFKVLNGGKEVGAASGASAADVNIAINGLKPATEYTFDVVCTDGSDNTADDTLHLAATTLTAPAAAPAPKTQAALVKAIYTDTYKLATKLNNNNEGWWEPTTVAEGELAAGDKALYYAAKATGMTGWSFDQFDATGHPYLHVSIYPLGEGTIEIYPVVKDQAEAAYHKTSATLKANEWNEVVLDYTGLDLTKVKQMGWINYYNLNGFFVDNVYFSARQDAEAAPAAGRRINAYGLNVEEGTGGYVFTYYANIDGTAANLIFYKDDVELGKVALEAPKAGLNSKTLSATEIPQGTGLTWAVELTADPVYEFGKVYEGSDLKKCHLAIDNSTESDYFGRMYIANRAGSATGGIYVYNQDFTPVIENTLAGQPKWQSMGRPAVGADGTVYIGDWGDGHGGVYVLDPKTLEAGTFFVGTQASSGLWTNADGVAMGSSTAAVGVYGEGANTVLYAMNEDVPATQGEVPLYAHGVNVYQIGQADGTILKTWDKAPTMTFALQDNAAQMFVINANEHGAFFSSSRSKGNNAAGARSLQFYNTKGERTYVALPEGATADLTGSLGGGCAVSVDLSELAIVDGDGNILVYSVAWTDDTPALTFVEKYTTEFAALGSLVFDYAGNLIATGGANYNNSTANHMVAYAVPTMENTVVVPAKKALTVSGTGEATSVDTIGSRYEGVQKVMIDGKIFIIRDGKTYNVMGVQVK